MYEIAIIGLLVILILLAGFILKKIDEFSKKEKPSEFGELMSKLTEFKTVYEKDGEKRKEVDDEKEKRFKEFIEFTKTFFGEEKEIREKLEKKRDDTLSNMADLIGAFSRTIHGTSTRGSTGEGILKEYLKNPIKSKMVRTNLKTENGVVEFAWDLGDGKYIPIDSKLPDVTDLLENYTKTENTEEQVNIKNQIFEKLKKEIARVRKYQNQSNTVDRCILVAPEGIIDTVPELIGYAHDFNVHLCSYKEVFLFGYIISEKYHLLRDQGELGDYKKINESLFSILEKIKSKTETIDRGISMVSNANDEIKTSARDSRNQKILF